MNKKLVSIFLSATLIFPVGAMPQVSAIGDSGIVQSKNSMRLNPKIMRALKYVGGTALTATGLYFVYNYLKPKSETTEGLSFTTKVVNYSKPPLTQKAKSKESKKEKEVLSEHEYSYAKKIDSENFNEFFNKYLESSEKLSKDEINEICEKATDVLKNEPSLLKINGPTIVVGDIHGNLGALEYSVRKFLEANGTKNILFLGDYVDRGMYAPGGPNSIKNVAILLKLKTMFPNKVFLLRGNHEIEDINCLYGFSGECDKAYGDNDVKEVFDKFNSVFNYLPLAAVVDEKTFCVHGGISPQLADVNKITEIEKPLSREELSILNTNPKETTALAVDLLWSDPEQLSWDNKSDFSSDDIYECQFLENTNRGAGKIFSPYAASKFLETTKLKRILRAHQEVDGHKDVFGNGSVITLFSAPDYRTKGSNRGEIAEINGEDITYETINYNDNQIVKP